MERSIYTSSTKRVLALLLCLVVVAAMTLALAACGKEETSENDPATKNTDISAGEQTAAKTIAVDIIDADGKTTSFTIATDEEFLRGALEQEELIEGDESELGLYVKSVNGITADFDTDGAYWAFSKGGEYLMSGVDDTPVADGDHFEITYTKG